MTLGVTLSGSAAAGGRALFGPLIFSVHSEEWTCLLGTSGAGKTTMLRLIAGLETGVAFEGTIAADDGISLKGRIALMAQTDLLLPWLDVFDNVLMGHRLRGEVTPEARLRAQDLIARVGLKEHSAKRPSALSGGMRQRAALARTLMEDRPLVLLDEPFSALDARTRAEMQELAFELLQGRTVLLVTHDPAEAARLGHRIQILDHGSLKEVEPPSSAAIRAYDDPEVFECQTAMMTRMRKAA
ncbi:MAG: ABC transporter ATP-binding protein [Pseudomonadota bacterium]